MKIKLVTKYVYKEEEYNSLKEIKEEIHNTIGLEVIDKIVRVCPPQKHKDLFKLLDVLCKKEVRDILNECLNVEFEEVQTDYDNNFNEQIVTINVLDL